MNVRVAGLVTRYLAETARDARRDVVDHVQQPGVTRRRMRGRIVEWARYKGRRAAPPSGSSSI